MSMIGITTGGNRNNNSSNEDYWTLKDMKKFYIYLLVIGYAVKYYLNETTKGYVDEMKRRYPNFFSKVFNEWVDKYSNRVLRTNPRKINIFYNSLFMME